MRKIKYSKRKSQFFKRDSLQYVNRSTQGIQPQSSRGVSLCELYFEILGFEQNSVMQIVAHYADDCAVQLKIPESLVKKDEVQEYGILACGDASNLEKFFQILESLFANKLLRGNLTEFAIQKLKQKSLSICVAESCTGGVLSSMLTSVNGASAVYKGGITAYSAESKVRVLGIRDSLLREHGVYSEECVKAMARGALDLFHADVAIATSGLATQDTSEANFLKLQEGLVFTCVLMRDKLPLVIAHNYLQHAKESLGIDKESTRFFVQKNASLQALRLLFELL